MIIKAAQVVAAAIALSSTAVVPAPAVETVDGVALLKVDAGARPAGMGAAFVSIAADPRAGSYNPAGAAGVSDFALVLEHNVYWDNIRFESVWFSWKPSSRAFWHGGLRFAAVDDIEARVIASSEPTGLFDAHDVCLKSGLAYEISSRLFAGFSLGVVYEKIEAFRGSALSFDLGVQAEPVDDLRVGLSAVQLGGDLVLSAPGQGDSDEIPQPSIYRAGASYVYDKYLGAADVVVVDSEAHLHLGAEGRLHRAFHLRAGYMFGYDSKNLTAGLSFLKGNVTVDYAFVPYTNNLGTTHVFNLTFGL